MFIENTLHLENFKCEIYASKKTHHTVPSDCYIGCLCNVRQYEHEFDIYNAIYPNNFIIFI